MTRIGGVVIDCLCDGCFIIIYSDAFVADLSARRTCAIGKPLFGYLWFCHGSFAYYTGFEILSGCSMIGKLCLNGEDTRVFCEYTT